MVLTVTEEHIVSIQMQFIQTLHCSVFILHAVLRNPQSPGVACGCMSIYIVLWLLSIIIYCRVIMKLTLQNDAAAPGDQSISNERPRDL